MTSQINIKSIDFRRIKIHFLYVLLIIIPELAWSQSAQDYSNLTVQKGQLKTTHRFLDLLESGNLDSIYKYTDSILFVNDTSAKTKILISIREIKKYKDSTKRSEGVIAYEDNHDVYKCSYYIPKVGEKFSIDIHYTIGNPKSKVVAIKIKLYDELYREMLDDNKYDKEHPGPPPSPH